MCIIKTSEVDGAVRLKLTLDHRPIVQPDRLDEVAVAQHGIGRRLTRIDQKRPSQRAQEQSMAEYGDKLGRMPAQTLNRLVYASHELCE